MENIEIGQVLMAIGTVTSLLLAYNAYKATKADIINKMSDSLIKTIGTIEKLRLRVTNQGARIDLQDNEISVLKGRIRILENINVLLREYIRTLFKQFKEHDIEPVTPPKELDLND